MIRKLSFFILFIAVSFFTFSQKQLTLEDLWQKYILYARPPQGLKSMNDGEHYSVNESEAIAKYNFLKGEKMLKIDDVILSIHHANRIKMPFNTLNDKRFV